MQDALASGLDTAPLFPEACIATSELTLNILPAPLAADKAPSPPPKVFDGGFEFDAGVFLTYARDAP